MSHRVPAINRNIQNNIFATLYDSWNSVQTVWIDTVSRIIWVYKPVDIAKLSESRERNISKPVNACFNTRSICICRQREPDVLKPL